MKGKPSPQRGAQGLDTKSAGERKARIGDVEDLLRTPLAAGTSTPS